MTAHIKHISIRIAGYPVTPGISAAFYQAEEEALMVPIIYENPHAQFYSSVESKGISLQCDKDGRLIFINIRKPRRLWIGERGISATPSPPADIRILDFRCSINEPEFLCDRRKTRALIKFAEVHSCDSFQLADNVFLLVYQRKTLNGIYIDTIHPDRAGQHMKNWKDRVSEVWSGR